MTDKLDPLNQMVANVKISDKPVNTGQLVEEDHITIKTQKGERTMADTDYDMAGMAHDTLDRIEDALANDKTESVIHNGTCESQVIGNEETLANILAGLRNHAKALESPPFDRDELESFDTAGTYRHLADRIEEAAKRMEERFREELDAAILNKDFRDTMEFCAKAMERRKLNDNSKPANLELSGKAKENAEKLEPSTSTTQSAPGNAAAMREALAAAGRAAREIQKVTEEADTAEVAISIAEICERALLFPPRNCDRFNAPEEAQVAFAKEVCKGRSSCSECDETGDCRLKWLFGDAICAGREPDDAPPNVGNAEATSGLPYVIIDGKHVAVLHGRVAKTPDGKIHDVVQSAPGNVFEMRKALEYAKRESEKLLYLDYSDTMTLTGGLSLIRERARAALAETPRNCDVGNAEEQEEKFNAYCADMGACERCQNCITGCSAAHDPEHCVIEWEQAPYEAKKEGGAE